MPSQPGLGAAALPEPDAYRAVVCFSPTFRVITWDEGAHRLFGWSSREARGAQWLDIVTTDPPSDWLDVQNQALLGGGSHWPIVTVARFVGKYRVVEVPMRLSSLGTPAGAVVFFHAVFVKQPAIFQPQFAVVESHDVGHVSSYGALQAAAEYAECGLMEAAPVLDKRDLVGVNIRRARQLRNMSQARLAKGLGIGRARLSDYEHGRYEPSWDRLGEIARLTRVDGPGWFYLDHPELDPDEDSS